MDKPNVHILAGKWQDMLEDPLIVAGGFDVIYTDTFSEEYPGKPGPSVPTSARIELCSPQGVL
jgi:hypothetical protein